MTNTRAIFDQYSKSYDSEFSHSFLGNYYRKRTHRIFKKYWNGNNSILELNSGTGEDALYLARLGNNVLVTDVSSSMLRIAEDKLDESQLGHKISLKQLSIEELDELKMSNLDGIASNFGGLNCINTWENFAENCSRLLRKEGLLMVCIMGPLVPWEWLWFSLKGKFSKAFRRVSGRCEWRGAKIYYPKPKRFESIMESESFKLLHREALGVFMPPPYANSHVKRWRKFYRFMANIEEMIGQSKIACRFADHYILVFEKKN